MQVRNKANLAADHLDIAIYFCIAALFIAAAWLIATAQGAFTPDPDYQYLMNGLDILIFKSPTYVDHPGTPAQTIIAAVLGSAWFLTLPWHGLSSIQDQVLAHPQFYLDCVCCFFTAAIGFALLFFVWSTRKTSGMMMPALIGLISIFPSSAVYVTFHRVMPEPVLLCATMLLTGLVAQQAYLPDGAVLPKFFAAVVGILLSFCVTTKVTSAPVLLTIFFLQPWSEKRTALIAGLVSAPLFLLPAVKRWRDMIDNYFHILTHRGDYGAGSAGAPSLSELLVNLEALSRGAPEMFASLALFLLVLLGHRALRHPLSRNLVRALWICTAVISAGIVMVTKQPRAYYLLPEIAFMCLGNTIVASLVFRNSRFSTWVGGIAIFLLGAQAYGSEYRNTQSDVTWARSNEATLAAAAQRDCRKVYYYGVNQTEFDLFFGNVSSGRWFGGALTRLYPDFVAYNTGTKQFETFTERLKPAVEISRLAGEKCIDFLGTKWQDDFGIPSDSLTLVAHNGGSYLYTLALRKKNESDHRSR